MRRVTPARRRRGSVALADPRSASSACALVSLALALVACDEPPPAPPSDPGERTTREVKAYVDAQIDALHTASVTLCRAAPAPDEDGWSDDDEPALERMRAAWSDARVAYERVEGAIAILFPAIDRSIDDRYEHVAELGRDDDPFDGEGFIGMHAIERILFMDRRASVDTFERALFGYAPPRRPANQAEATAFRDGLCARLVSDVASMQRDARPLALDPQTAWRGIQGSIEEQAEKVALGATGQDESRYADATLADMRSNLEGGRAVLDAYRPLIEANDTARGWLRDIDDGFDRLEAAYGSGRALPPVPDGFDPDAPSDAHLATPYGRLFQLLTVASDPARQGSLANLVVRTGEAMGIRPLSR